MESTGNVTVKATLVEKDMLCHEDIYHIALHQENLYCEYKRSYMNISYDIVHASLLKARFLQRQSQNEFDVVKNATYMQLKFSIAIYNFKNKMSLCKFPMRIQMQIVDKL